MPTSFPVKLMLDSGAYSAWRQRVVARRQPEARIQAAAVDAFDLPSPIIGAVGAVGAGKPGHAGNRQGAPDFAVRARRVRRAVEPFYILGAPSQQAGEIPPCAIRARF